MESGLGNGLSGKRIGTQAYCLSVSLSIYEEVGKSKAKIISPANHRPKA